MLSLSLSCYVHSWLPDLWWSGFQRVPEESSEKSSVSSDTLFTLLIFRCLFSSAHGTASIKTNIASEHESDLEYSLQITASVGKSRPQNWSSVKTCSTFLGLRLLLYVLKNKYSLKQQIITRAFLIDLYFCLFLIHTDFLTFV